MRSVISVAIVTLLMAISLNAAPNGPEIEMTVFRVIIPSSSHANDDSQGNGMENVALLDDFEREEQEDVALIMRRFKEFSAKFVPTFRGASDCVFSPLTQYLFLLTFPYGREKDFETKVMEALGFTYQERQIVKRAVQQFIKSLNGDYVQFETEDPILKAIENMHEWWQRGQPMSCQPRLSSDDLVNYVFGGRAWDIILPNVRSEMRDFYVNGKERVSISTMCGSTLCRYGKLEDLDSTFMEIIPEKDGRDKDTRIYIIRGDSPQGFELLMQQLGKMNFTRFREFRETAVNYCVPKTVIRTNIDVQSWAPQVFGYNNPFEPGSNYDEFLTSFFVELKANRTVRHFLTDLSTKILNNLWKTSIPTPTASSAEAGASHSSQSGEGITFNVDRPFIVVEVETNEPYIELYNIIVTGSIFKQLYF